MPPTVAVSSNVGGSQGSIWLASCKAAFTKDRGVPARTVITSSEGSYATMPQWLQVSMSVPAIGRPRKALLPAPRMRRGARSAAAWRTCSSSRALSSYESIRFMDGVLSRRALEALQFRKRQLPRVHVHGAEFGASLQCWNIFPRVQQACRVKRGLDGMKQVQLIAIELRAHLVDFFAPHAVLAGDGAAHLHA